MAQASSRIQKIWRRFRKILVRAAFFLVAAANVQPPNNAGLLPAAEVVEGRRPTKGNTKSTAASRTLSRLDALIVRLRVREAAGFYANHPK